MAADPSVSPADTPGQELHTNSTDLHTCGDSPAPADTIRHLLEAAQDFLRAEYPTGTDHEADAEANRLECAVHHATTALPALLAVGEQDKAEIERLAGIEAAARALMDAEDADEEAVDRLIAEDDTDGSLSEAQALTRANADATSDALRAVLAGGESPGERDRRQIAQLTEALTKATWHLANYTFRGKDTSLGEEAARLFDEYLSAAVLADEEAAG